jgi:hypothetical protein
MSPVGGVGINLAIQDAVAAANILAQPLRKGALSTSHLAKIQRRREFAVKHTQRVRTVILRHLTGDRRAPWPIRLLEATTLPRRLRTRFVCIGVRPEHVETPDAFRVSFRTAFSTGCSGRAPGEIKSVSSFTLGSRGQARCFSTFTPCPR